MRKFLLFISVLLPGFTTIVAQNFQSYYSNRSIAFSNPYAGSKFQKVDSTEVNQGDSIFWFFPNFDWDDDFCIKPDGPNWSGRKVIIRENGDNIFFNKLNDSILIKTHAELNIPWLAYENPDTYRIFAQVIAHDTLTFLSLTDSVKTISFQVYDINNDSVSHVLNSKHLHISKSHGLLNTFLFRDFPFYYASDFDRIDYSIAGISDPKLGLQNLTWKDVFDDFYPGDELHVIYENCSGLFEEQFCYQGKSIFRYLNRTEYPDSVRYSIERISGNKELGNGSILSYEYTHDTIMSLINYQANLSFNRFSEESIIDEDFISYNLQSKKNLGAGKYAESKTVDLHDDLVRISEDCWVYPISDALTIKYNYIKGLGGPYYSASIWWFNYTERELVYYKKGEEENGTPLTIDDETDIAAVAEPSISVFPNPTKDFIRLKADIEIPYLFEIIDVNGHVLKAELIDSNDQQIDISYLKEGIYIYQLRKNNLVFKTGKLMIK